MQLVNDLGRRSRDPTGNLEDPHPPPRSLTRGLGLWLLDELAEHGHKLCPGTLYPALARMRRNGWLKPSGRAGHARARQTFRITPEGRRLLKALRREVTELYREVVLGKSSKKREARSKRRP